MANFAKDLYNTYFAKKVDDIKKDIMCQRSIKRRKNIVQSRLKFLYNGGGGIVVNTVEVGENRGGGGTLPFGVLPSSLASTTTSSCEDDEGKVRMLVVRTLSLAFVVFFFFFLSGVNLLGGGNLRLVFKRVVVVAVLLVGVVAVLLAAVLLAAVAVVAVAVVAVVAPMTAEDRAVTLLS